MLAALVAASAADTIVAPATAPGAAAIAIVRLSGPGAFAIGESMSQRALPPPYRLARRTLCDRAGTVLDHAMLACMPAATSYTGDDLVELQLHGSPAVVRAVLGAAQALGARAAEPGEYTRRAVLNGRLALPSAEGVGALIHADSEAARRGAVRLLAGGLEKLLAPPYEALEGLVAGLRASLDFPDDVASPWPAPGFAAALAALREQLQAAFRGLRLPASEGPSVVLLGPPNAGKSTLMNALLGEERALTDPGAGTTRDAISAPWRWRGSQVTLWDTAGLRVDALGVEARGMAKGAELAARADLRLWLLGQPAAWPPAALTAETADLAAGTPGERGPAPLWLVGSHADAVSAPERLATEAAAAARGLPFAGWLSVPTGEGTQALSERLGAHFAAKDDAPGSGSVLTATARHLGGLRQALSALQAATESLQRRAPADCVLGELEDALAALSAVLGKDADAALLDRVFADFCIGK